MSDRRTPDDRRAAEERRTIDDGLPEGQPERRNDDRDRRNPEADRRTGERRVDNPSRTFYADTPVFTRFEDFADLSNYRELPDDWCIVIADIQGSTKAIQEGRYKDVNMIGAACITATLNALKKLPVPPEIPYVFGGDGATLAVPGGVAPVVREALERTKYLSERQFGLTLRIGIVPERDVRANGGEVLVAKYELSPGNTLAMFNGGGVEIVDNLVKDEERGRPYRVEVPTAADINPDLEGLSCRWQPIKSQQGRMVSLLVLCPRMRTTERTELYFQVEERLREVLGGAFPPHSPASDEGLRFVWPPRRMWTEIKATAERGIRGFLAKTFEVLFQSAFQCWLHRFGGEVAGYNGPVYKREVMANTDYQRFDDTLRMVLDCSEQQISAMQAELERLRAETGIAYGMHISDTALMTCLVFSIEESQHLHFMDGGDGGFAIAARQMKAQLKA
ncbi:MAG: DUF3095 domain-containing protein [Rhodospirillales bacterium]